MKILVIKRDKIGDLVLTTPLFELLKARLPAAELHLLVNTYNGWVAENDPHIDRLWLYPRVRDGKRVHPRALLSQLWQLVQLRRQRYDWIIIAGGSPSWRANYRARRIAGPATRIVAYCEPDRRQGISDPLDPPTRGHEVERMAALLAPLGVAVAAADIPFPHFQPRAAWLDAARSFLAAKGLAAGGYVMLGVGARRRLRQPEAAQVLRWAKALHDRFGLHTVFTWTPGGRDDPLYPGDDDIAEAVLAERPAWLHPYRGELGTVVGLTWLARTSLYPDSGLMHVAAASPGGVVALFADPENSSSPDLWGPRGARTQILVAGQRVADLPDDLVMAALAGNMQAS